MKKENGTVVKMHQLSNTNACTGRRTFPFQEMLNTGEVTMYMERSGLIVRSALEAATSLYEAQTMAATTEEEKVLRIEKENEVMENLRVGLEMGFDSLDYKSENQKAIQMQDAFRICERYAKSYAKNAHSTGMISPEPRDVELSDTLLVEEVAPSGIDVYKAPVDMEGKPVAEFMLHAFKLHASKPKLTQEKVYESLEPYTLLKYLESRVLPGHTAYLKADIAYLRKENDRNGENPNFDPDFYNTVGGRNIVTLEEVYYAPKNGEVKTETDYDRVYRKVVDAYVEGFREEECSEEDCENCELRNICKFTSAPVAQVKLPAIRSLGALKLTKAQQDIVAFRKGILRVLAGPGSGKTMCLSVRIVSMLDEGIAPEDFLLITFTDAAAKEMKERVAAYNEDLAGIDISGMRIMTFNSFGDWLIGLRYEDLGFSRKPSVIDDVERSMIISDLLCQHGEIKGLDYRNYETDMKNCKGALAMVRRIFEIVKAGEDGVSFGIVDAEKVYEKLGAERRFISAKTTEERLDSVKQVIRLYDLYDEKLREEHLIEYADQETMPFELIRKDPTFLASLGIKHLLVDEFQDSNSNNLQLCKELVHMKGLESAMFVGDPTQSIYAFRGGMAENLLKISEKLGRPVVDIPLMENFRSDANICSFANEIVSKTYLGLPKIIPTRPDRYPVTVKGFHFKEDEIAYVTELIEKHLSGEAEPKADPEDIAVLCATKGELLELADALGAAGIDTVLLAPELLKDNSRVNAAMACIRAIQDPNNRKDLVEYSFARFVKDQATGTSLTRLDELRNNEKAFSCLITEVEEELKKARSLTRTEQKNYVMELLRAIDENDDEVYEGFVETIDRKQNMAQISDYIASFGQFGDKVAKRRLSGFSAVVLTTAHSSKGLEWNVVINMISKYDEEIVHSKSSAYQEKLNLLYVSETRARERAYITGRYIAFGKKGNYTYNRYLVESLEAVGQPFDRQQVEEEKRKLDLERKQRKSTLKETEKEIIGLTRNESLSEKAKAV